MIYRILLQQQSTMDRIETGENLARNVINMAVIGQSSPQSMPSVVQAQFSEIGPTTKQSTQVITKPAKPLLWTVRSNRWGFSAQVVAIPKEEGTSYRTAVHMSLFGKMYSVQLQMSCPSFSFDHMSHVRNIVPTDSAMTVACLAGDFNSALQLLTSGSAHGSDITPGGWPMLDVSVNFFRTKLRNANNTGSTLSRAGLPGSSACSSNMELIRIWCMGSITCELSSTPGPVPVVATEPLLTGSITGQLCNLPSFEDTSTLPDFS